MIYLRRKLYLPINILFVTKPVRNTRKTQRSLHGKRNTLGVASR